MPAEGREKGVRTPYAVIFGLAPLSYAGVNTQNDAAALPDAQGVEGINLRIIGGRPSSRGGQTKVNASALAPIHGFCDTSREEY
jgi:hypothetical protein